MKNPRTRPKFIDPKKSSISILNTNFRFRCVFAFVKIVRVLLNPWDADQNRTCSVFISDIQLYSSFESLDCASANFLFGDLISLVPPVFLGYEIPYTSQNLSFYTKCTTGRLA